MHRIIDVLRSKGSRVLTVSPDASVTEAVRIMNEHHIGAVLVMHDKHPIGIFTERDVLVRIVAADRDANNTLVREVMTRRIFIVDPDTSVIDAIQVITEKRCRHLPVLENGKLVGLVSIGDLSKVMQQSLRQEVHALASYISSPYLAEEKATTG